MRIIFMIQEIARKLTKDNLTGYAAQSCFYIILSIFPCLLLLMSLFKFLPLTEDALLLMLKGVIPVQLEPFLVSIIEDLYDNSSAALTSITTVATIWAAGKGFLAIMQELNIIYDTQTKLAVTAADVYGLYNCTAGFNYCDPAAAGLWQPADRIN